MVMNYRIAILLTVAGSLAAASCANAQQVSVTPSFVMASDLRHTCRQVFDPASATNRTSQDLVDLVACWAFMGGMRSMLTAYEEVVLGGSSPPRQGGRFICIPESLTFEQTLEPIVTMMRERPEMLRTVQSHAFVIGAWARAFACR
jgi:hypothetical protein